ncbi:uncharacterized protein LOC117587441 [Drosophila guanche]|uniref:Uncharacterized protein n=1 Tax=Drosophila guanche TaxID=7266 RepID=A0A3B0KER0_DROGU|nr:uncharacterized protein LOC117587441 [Drosophila guanche]SPP84789.1 Hypothetical predicted protein [Drosophila guanche]
MHGTMPDVVCCRCGSLPHSLPYCIGGTGREYHCFCCLKSPPQKCINCNAWRDIDLSMAHTGCPQASFHVFVYTEPWPPFPSETVNIPAVQPSSADLIPFNYEPEQAVPEVRAEPEDLIVLDDDEEQLSEPEDVKPPRKPLQESHWYTVNEIKEWTHCIRCNKERNRMAGWIKHAQMCGQDPHKNAKKFFIYNHIKGWCNYLVMDCRWDTHSAPSTGTCRTCRTGRERGNPLPYMPQPPARPNERKLAAQRLRNRRMRKQRRMTRMFSPLPYSEA